ncbi:hypothetical protein VaNZ11_004501 [Volvox africanus]|uniref:Apoptosis antagonizing transcription factor n=1 Tax=Volvox africanus TaxID=51714 RepID=A0ABQ5RWN2_9CHLO|nr:hypothetical protein VaNZ11_004501 [Volvox africanus]
MVDKKKSFAQELADLFNPAPTKEYDPDEVDLGDAARLPSDEEYGDARAAPSKRAPEKAMLLRGDITLEDAAYRGRKTSRSEIFGGDGGKEDAEDGYLSSDGLGDQGDDDDDGDDGDDDDDSEDGLKRRPLAGHAGPSGQSMAASGKVRTAGATKRGAALVNGVADNSDRGEGDDEEDAEGAAGSGLASGSGSEIDEDAMEEEDQAAEEEEAGANGRILGRTAAVDGRTERVEQRQRADGRFGDGRGRGGDELGALEAEYEALQEEDEKQLETLRKKGERDRVKGAAVRNQQVLYERALEQRILLQKCLQASNGLPRPDTFAALLIAKPDIREGYEQLAVAARDTLGLLLELQHTLMARNSAIRLSPVSCSGDGSAASGAKRQRLEPDPSGNAGDAVIDNGLECLWQRISLHHEALAPFRDLSLDSWHRRTVLSSGSGALRNSGLRALNKSISNQVQALMRDPAKFIKRTRLAVATCPRVLCEMPRSSAAAAAALDPLGSDGNDAPEGRDGTEGPSSTVAAEILEEERDPETYDDGEFYQQLLKEFLDKGILEGASVMPKGAKKRKLVDRRASKGRKLRYHVQDKLVAFMAPVDFTPPPFAANLFSNLFGHSGR